VEELRELAGSMSVLVAGTLPQTTACPDVPMHVSSRDRAVRLRRRRRRRRSRSRSRLRFPTTAEIGEETTTLALDEDSETAR
jgi:hypothetical protein